MINQTNMNKVELKDDGQGGLALFINGKMKCCPFQQPLIVPADNGRLVSNPSHQVMNVVYKNCGSWCALFEVVQSEKISGVFINCMSNKLVYQVHNQQPPDAV